jgi:hypothetical protein
MPAYLGVWIVTQRLAMLATDARELCNASIVHKLRGENDLKFARPWVEDFDDPPPGTPGQAAPRRGDRRRPRRGRHRRRVPDPAALDVRHLQLRRRPGRNDQRQPKGRSSVDLSALDATLGEALKRGRGARPRARCAAASASSKGQLRGRRADGRAGKLATTARGHDTLALRTGDSPSLQDDTPKRDARRPGTDAPRERAARRGATWPNSSCRASRRCRTRQRVAQRADARCSATSTSRRLVTPGGYPGDEHILELIRAHAPEGRRLVSSRPACRSRRCALTTSRTHRAAPGRTRIRELGDDEREALLFLIGQQTYPVHERTWPRPCPAHDGGGVRQRWASAEVAGRHPA